VDGKTIRLAWLLLAAACGGDQPTVPPWEPPPSTASGELGSIVDSVRQAFGLPAMGGAIVTTAGLRNIGVAGVRRWNGTIAVTLGDKWHLGSNLKAQTAALAAMAVDAGRINWSTTVGQAFPELSGTIRADIKDVTLEDLLAHRGGIRNDPPSSAWSGSTAREQRESAVAWGTSNAPAVPRGTYFYSNVGFVIAGAMVERAFNGTYEDLMRDRFWTPVGASGPGWGPQALAGATDQPVAHRRSGSAWVACEGCDNPPGLSAAGRAHMPLADWAAIIAELLRADAGTSTLISPASGRKLTTEHVGMAGGDSYAQGWVVVSGGRPWGGARVITHSGSNTVNHSVAWVSLSRGFAVLGVTNAADLDGGVTTRALDGLAGRLIRYYETGQ
jgi:CubicO group peptidase (beta-lactamase class C family)